jgi:hypothetical protein
MAVTLVGPGSTTGNTALAASRAVPVPNNGGANPLQAGDIVEVTLSRWESINPAVTAPSGFVARTQAVNGSGKLNTYLKRLTAADTGTYTFSWTGSMWTTAQARAYRGVDPAADLTTVPLTSATNSGTSWPAATLSGVGAGVLDWHGYSESNGNPHTQPTSFTKLTDNDSDVSAYQIVAAGSYTTSGGSAVASSPNTVVMTHLPETSGGSPVTLTVSNVGQAQHPAATALTQVHNLAVANAGQAQHPAATALTQVHNLAISGASQSQSTAATALTQVHQLSVANADQAQSVAATALSQVHQLAISDIGQAQGPGVPTLTQTHVLAVTGPGQAQAPGTVTLTQVHVLAVSGAAQTQATSSLTLTGPGNLDVANVGQSQLSAGLALTQVHNLQVAGVGQSQGPSSANVVGPGQLAISDVGQGQTAGAVVLTQAHQLVVAAAIQGQQTEAATLTQEHQLEIWSGPVQTQAPGDAQVDSGGIEPAPIDGYQWLTLGDLMDARATHESIMLDVISVRHPGMTEAAFDPDLGYAPATPKPDYYHGKATVQARQISAGLINPAGLGTLTQLGYAVHAPVGTAIDQAAPDDIIVVNESADPRHQDLVLLVKNVESSSFATARRLVCTLYEPSTP